MLAVPAVAVPAKMTFAVPAEMFMLAAEPALI